MSLSHSQPSGASLSKTNSSQSGQTALPPMDGLKTLFRAMNTLGEDASYRELASVMKEIETLRAELSSREKVIKQLELTHEDTRNKNDSKLLSLIDGHQKHYAKLQDERDRLLNDATTMQESKQKDDDSRKALEKQQTKMQDDLAKLEEELQGSNAFVHEERQRYLKLERDFKAAQDEIQRLETTSKQREGEMSKIKEAKQSLEKKYHEVRQLQLSSKEELGRIRGMAVRLKQEPLDDTKEKLETLSRDAWFLVNKHFQFNLPESSEQNDEFGNRLKEVSKRLVYVSTQAVPLPRRNSNAAKNMRCALVLAWLMQRIDAELFQPNYIIPVETGIRHDLNHEAMKDRQNESFRRAFLLSVLPEIQTRVRDRRATSVVKDIMWLVEGIIHPDQANALQSDLRVLVDHACTSWQAIQQLLDKFEPSMNYTSDDGMDWLNFPFEHSEASNDDDTSTTSSTSNAAASKTPDEAVLVVFPRMYLVKDADPKPVTPGIVLRESQTIAAALQVRTEVAKSSTLGRGPLTFPRDGRRRDSIIADTSLANRSVGPFLGQGSQNGPSR